MTPDWSKLAPHRPLEPGSADYAAPPHSAGEEIAARIAAGNKTILVGGPAGIGKSTELARAAVILRRRHNRVACLAPIDLWENMRRLTPDQLLLRIAGRVAYLAHEVLHLPLSRDIRTALVRVDALKEAVPKEPAPGSYRASPRALAGNVLDELSRLSTQRQITLLVDGMEKIPDEPRSIELFDALAELPDHVEQVVVVPWHVTYGQHAETVIRPGEHWSILSPGRVEGDAGEPTRAFLRLLVARRLGLNLTQWATDMPDFAMLLDLAAVKSGGIPRTFLQLVADAGTYARLRRKNDWPNDEDLADAVADLEDSFRRVLLPGDTTAVLLAEGTDGRELDLSRRIRLLARGVLLERRSDQRVVLEIHPLARRAIEEGN